MTTVDWNIIYTIMGICAVALAIVVQELNSNDDDDFLNPYG